jgi:hypothetical protein
MSALLEPDCEHLWVSPRTSEVRDYDRHVATVTTVRSCMACHAVLATEEHERRLVAPWEQPRGYCGDGSDPDRGTDRHLSGSGWALRLARSRRSEGER